MRFGRNRPPQPHPADLLREKLEAEPDDVGILLEAIDYLTEQNLTYDVRPGPGESERVFVSSALVHDHRLGPENLALWGLVDTITGIRAEQKGLAS